MFGIIENFVFKKNNSIELSKNTIFKINEQIIINISRTEPGFIPFRFNLLGSEINRFQSSFIIGKYFFVTGVFSQDSIKTFNDICGVNKFTNFKRII